MTSPASPAATATPSRSSSVNALHWIGGVVALGYLAWHWMEFSGPVRWLVDLQVRLTGRYYWEPLAIALLVGVLLCAVVLVANLLDPIARRVGTKDWVAMVLVVAIAVSVFVLVRAWHLWNAPEAGATHRFPPVSTLDLDTLGAEMLPRGLVRVIGRAEHDEQVRLDQEPRGYHTYQPVSGLKRPASELPVPVIAFCATRHGEDCIGEKLDGWLLPDGIGGRDYYRLRRAGLLTAGHHYLLLPGLPTRAEYVEDGPGDPGEAVACVLFLFLFWFTVIFSWIKTPPTPAKAKAPVENAEAELPATLYAVAGGVAVVVFVLLSVLTVLSWAIRSVF